MDIDQERQSALHTVTAVRLLDKARLDISLAVLSVAQPSPTDFGASNAADRDGAREVLAQHRMTSPSYRPPQEQKRNIFRTDRKKQEVQDTTTWKFTKHEVACTFDKILSSDTRTPPGIAQAVLSYAAVCSIDELRSHFRDAKLEQAPGLKTAFRRSSRVFVPDVQASWLDDVTQRDDAEYVQLICQAGVQQEALDSAFAVALDRRSLKVMQILLAFGARASAQEDKMRVLFADGDFEVAKVLLSAPPAAGVMSTDALRHSLATLLANEKGQPHSVLLACLANRSAIVCPDLLIAALASQNVQTVAALLACTFENADLQLVNHKACVLVSGVENAGLRFDLFSLLSYHGLLIDGENNRQELMTDVKLRLFQLVDLMVAAGVAVDEANNDTISYAVSIMDLDILGRLQKGVFTRAAATALDVLPKSVDEPQLLHLIDLLAPRDLTSQALDVLLVRAVSDGFVFLLEKLVDLGASIDYKYGQAMRIAISKADINVLRTLLRRPCALPALSAAISSAMSKRPRDFRSQAMEALIEKGVRGDELGIPLQNLIHEEGEIDAKLVQILLRSGAPIDGVGNQALNVVLHAARRCDLTVLELLCDYFPSHRTLAQAVKVAYEARRVSGHDKALQTMTLLLTRGAVGSPINETLLAATFEGTESAIVRLLVDHGADANLDNGAAFAVALGARDPNLLKILCNGSPPTQATIENNIYTALDPQHFEPSCLEMLLCSSPPAVAAAALNANWDPTKLIGHPELRFIILCFLRYGLSVDQGNGALICLALQQADTELLRHVLLMRPNNNSLSAAFERALVSVPRGFALQAMEMLLETAQSAEIGQSRALSRETSVALRGDMQGLRLLLRYIPDVDFDNGFAMSLASEGDTKVLSHFLGHHPSIKSLHRACLAAAGSPTLSPVQKLLTFTSLLDARDREMTDASHMLRLIADSVNRFPTHTQLPELLIQNGARVDFETFATAIRSASPALFKALWNSHTGTKATATAIFRETREADIRAERKYWIYELLLTKKVSKIEISRALVDGLRGKTSENLDMPKLLLENGALVGHDSCAAFDHALSTNSLAAVRLLSQYLLDDKTASVAFEHARIAISLSSDVRLGVYKCLLQWNIDAQSIYQALIHTLEATNPDERLAQLLLTKAIDPNQEEGRCLMLAAFKRAEVVYRQLSKFADVTVVAKALIKRFDDEEIVVHWLNMCLAELRTSASIDDDGLLYECMRKWPASSSLLKVLLNHGVSPGAPIKMAIAVDCAAELCTPLIWALTSTNRIENDTIRTLIKRGGNKVLPTYSTITSGITAPFLCLLEQSRTPVLKSLIKLDKRGVTACETPVAPFRSLASGETSDGQHPEDSLPARIPLPQASIFLGNLKAYKAFKIQEIRNDGTLHTAAFLALPDFVAWLLSFHDPNAKVVDEFDHMIPLALVCRAQSRSWHNLPNPEADHVARQKRCIRLLAPETKTSWRYRNKSVLHEALDCGPEITKAMLKALEVKKDPLKNQKYLYEDKDGINYSPDQYVLKLMQDVDSSAKEALTNLLQGCNLKSRYFKAVMPGDGEQPEGFRGLPARYAKAWKEHAKTTVVSIPSAPTTPGTRALQRL